MCRAAVGPRLHTAAAGLSDILLGPAEDAGGWPAERLCQAEVADVLMVGEGEGEVAAVGDGQAEDGMPDNCPTDDASPKGLGDIRLGLPRFLAGVRAGGAECAVR